jgi:ABC-type thiamine transport system substrate-binding protein
MTLAFELSALKALADPNAVFNNARQWTEYVGVVSEKPTYVVTNFTRKHRVRQDFFSGPRGVEESLENIKSQFDTDRHVFVGVDADDEALADATEWEFLDVEDAASAAGWTVGAVEESTPADAQTRDDWP